MKSRTTARFRWSLTQLPRTVQRQARAAYTQFKEDPRHPGLRFKKVHPSKPIYSVRVCLGYRALGVLQDDVVIWFWIGSHADYDRLLSKGASENSAGESA